MLYTIIFTPSYMDLYGKSNTILMTSSFDRFFDANYPL